MTGWQRNKVLKSSCLELAWLGTTNISSYPQQPTTNMASATTTSDGKTKWQASLCNQKTIDKFADGAFTSDLSSVPGGGKATVATLKDGGITNTYQLIAMFIELKASKYYITALHYYTNTTIQSQMVQLGSLLNTSK